jgi:glutathione peroxidase-family protein
MLNRMQKKYAEKPVRFLLIPCNLFGGQEPAPNSGVEAFAQKSVTLAKGSNVLMLAKSNLNGVHCSSEGTAACAPASATCCPKNDAVYQYLLAKTHPGTIQWNFDKIITGKDGKPYAAETIFHGPALDEDLSVVIDRLLDDGKAAGAVESLLSLHWAAVSNVPYLAAAICAAGLLAAWSFAKKKLGSSGAKHELTADYILVA